MGPDFGLLKANKGSQPYGVILRMSGKTVCTPKSLSYILAAGFTQRQKRKKNTFFPYKYTYGLKYKFLWKKVELDLKVH